MTGPEHYREAEKLVEQAREQQSDNGPGCGSEETLAEAQVHATLALTAATAGELIAGAVPEPGDYGTPVQPRYRDDA